MTVEQRRAWIVKQRSDHGRVSGDGDHQDGAGGLDDLYNRVDMYAMVEQ